MMESKKTRISRSRSKTPSSDFDHRSTRSGRKTPTVISSTQTEIDIQPIIIEENEEIFTSPPAHRTRNALKQTSDYSSEEQENSPNRLIGFTKEQSQNVKNYSYEEHIYTTRSEKADSIQSTQDVSQSHNRHSRSKVSPSQSNSSFKSSFAELALADVSKIREFDDSDEQLPYKLYKYAGEYWNKYPKTDYTYSRCAKDYVELAPGQIAMPNMSRRSLQDFRLYGATEIDSDYMSTSSLAADSLLKTNWSDYDGIRKRTYFQDNEEAHRNALRYRCQRAANDHYWLTRTLISVWTKIVTTVTTITTTTTNTNTEPYPYYYGNQAASAGNGIFSRLSKGLAAPFVFLASKISRFCSFENVSTIGSSVVAVPRKRKFWYFLIPLLLCLASYYVYENPDTFLLPLFEDFQPYLPEFDLSQMSFPKLPDMPTFNISLSDVAIPITLPELSIPELPETYYEYKNIVADKFDDVSDYLKIIISSSYEEISRYLHALFGQD